MVPCIFAEITIIIRIMIASAIWLADQITQQKDVA
jgi:hypothetical protein